MSKYLVTTALEETWPDKNEEILFLGEWCKLYDRKNIWSKLTHKVVPYHWDDRLKLFKDFNELNSIYELVLKELADTLNSIHGVNHSLRYWRVLIGFWLGWFIQIVFDRWFMLKYTINNFSNLTCILVSRQPFSLTSYDMSSFAKESTSDLWNEGIFTELISLCFKKEINIEKLENNKSTKCLPNDNNLKSLNNFRHITKNILYKINCIIGRNDDYFFLNTYLNKIDEFKVQVLLGQIPQYWSKIDTEKFLPNAKLREFKIDKNISHDCNFINVVCKLIPIHLPTFYLEGYRNTLDKLSQCNWPKNPKGIFTSNSYFIDDFFKLWAAEKIENGARLNIGQHGGNIGMSKFAFHEEHQYKISDRFISWGWDCKENFKIKPFGIIKNSGRSISSSPHGDGLLVTTEIPRYSYHLYSVPIGSVQWLEYFDDQLNFLNKLPSSIFNSFKIRPYNGSGFGNFFKQKLTDYFKGITFDEDVNMINSARDSRIMVSSYNATTLLESLSWNMPTIGFWNPNFWELNKKAQHHFEALHLAGIFHDNPFSAAQKITEIWNNVNDWWFSKTVQKARYDFCEIYAKKNKNLKNLVDCIC